MRERKVKEDGGIRYVCEDVILEVDILDLVVLDDVIRIYCLKFWDGLLYSRW